MTDSLFFYYSGQTRARGVFCHFLSWSSPHSCPMSSGFLGLRRTFKHRSSLYFLPFGLQAQRRQVSVSPLICLTSLPDQTRGVVALPPYTNSLLLLSREPGATAQLAEGSTGRSVLFCYFSCSQPLPGSTALSEASSQLD